MPRGWPCLTLQAYLPRFTGDGSAPASVTDIKLEASDLRLTSHVLTAPHLLVNTLVSAAGDGSAPASVTDIKLEASDLRLTLSPDVLELGTRLAASALEPLMQVSVCPLLQDCLVLRCAELGTGLAASMGGAKYAGEVAMRHSLAAQPTEA